MYECTIKLAQIIQKHRHECIHTSIYIYIYTYTHMTSSPRLVFCCVVTGLRGGRDVGICMFLVCSNYKCCGVDNCCSRHVCLHSQVCMYIYIYVNMNTYILMYTHMCVCVRESVRSRWAASICAMASRTVVLFAEWTSCTHKYVHVYVQNKLDST